MMIRLVTIAAVLVTACGGTGDDDGQGDMTRVCAPWSGPYRVAHRKVSGNCGDIPERIETADGEPSLGEGCTGKVAVSPDHCTITVDETCPLDGQSGTLTARGKLIDSKDGKTASGTVYYEVNAGAESCTAIYEVTQTLL